MGHIFILILISCSYLCTGQQSMEDEAAYTATITLRAGKIVDSLGISDHAIVIKVRDIIVDQYRNLNRIHSGKELKLKEAKELKAPNKTASDSLAKTAVNEANSLLYLLHFSYLSKLAVYLNNTQIDKVKDGMTYGILPITYKGYCDMILNLTDEQKNQIKIWLTEAREYAMDAGSSDEKHQWFGKYKGRINNFLSAAGYDMKKEGENWQKRIKEQNKQ
jgi:hypothetical protein